jgi:hypothetical protein
MSKLTINTEKDKADRQKKKIFVVLVNSVLS